MKDISPDEHRKLTVAQFTAQAAPFAALPAHSDAIPCMVEASGAGPDSEVLDVACGPGLVACAFASVAQRVTGIDVTPAMLAGAATQQRAAGLKNLDWVLGEAGQLPFGDESFSHVVTRYSFHHFLEPGRVFREMVRVCRPGGVIVVTDVIVPQAESAGYDAFERLRDPSHVHALDEAAMRGLFESAGVSIQREAAYELPMKLEAQVAASVPVERGAEKMRAMLRANLGVDSTGLAPWEEGGELFYRYPVRIYVGSRDVDRRRA